MDEVLARCEVEDLAGGRATQLAVHKHLRALGLGVYVQTRRLLLVAQGGQAEDERRAERRATRGSEKKFTRHGFHP